MKKFGLIPIVSMGLVACAGGPEVETPQILAPIPTLSALSADTPDGTSASSIQTVEGSSGTVTQVSVTKASSWGGSYQEDALVYTTAGGKRYLFGLFNTPVLPSYSQADQTVPTKHQTQGTDDGGSLFACCSDTNIYFPAMKLEKLKFGVWISPNGQANFFAGGMPADEGYMQGGTAPEVDNKKGKANYEVWAIRYRSGSVVSSSYNPKGDQAVKSVWVANFNTAQLGGTIIGNADFGPSIELTDVSLKGAKFSGKVTSAGISGDLNGQFFGEHSSSIWSTTLREYAGSEIGGVIHFAEDSSLDAAFGGKRSQQDLDTQDTSLTPLQE